MLKLLKPQADITDGDGNTLPGPTWICTKCFARVRQGAPHRGTEPYAHSTLEACVVHETIEAET